MAAFKETTLRPKIINISNNIISIFTWYFYMVMTQIIVFFAARQTEKPSTSTESRSRKSLLEEKPKSYRNKGSSNIDYRAQWDYNKHSR